MATFGELLAQYMTRTGVSDSELARHLGVSRQTIFRWKEGLTARPRVREDVIRCADKLRVTPTERAELLVAAGFAPAQEPPAPYETVAAPNVSSRPNPELNQDRVLRDDTLPFLNTAGTIAPSFPTNPSVRQRLPILLALGAVALVLIASVTLLLQFQNGNKADRVTPNPIALPSSSGNSQDTVIVLGRLTHAGGETPTYDVTARLRQGIEREVDAARLTARVSVSPNLITDDGTAAAVQVREGAAILLWGTYEGSRVQIHLTGTPGNGAVTSHLPLTQTLTFDSASPDDVRALGLAVVVQLLWTHGDPVQARAFLVQAEALPNLSADLATTLNAWNSTLK